jgi:hypothetical protein
MDKTKSQKFLEGRKIVEVIHQPQKLILCLDNGTHFEVSAFATGWEVDSCGLDFKFKEDL